MVELEYKRANFKEMFGDFKYGTHILVLGSTGSGKTNFILWFLLNLNMKTVVFNPIRHVEFLKICDAIIDENVVYSDEFERMLSNPDITSICVLPSEEFLGNKPRMTRLFSVICKKCFLHEDKVHTRMMELDGKKKGLDFQRKSNIVLVNDELMMVTDMEKLHKYHFGIIHAGRNYGISHVGLTQRHQLISKLIATQSQVKIVYWMDKYDVEALEDKIECVQYARFLDPYHFIVQKPFGDIKFYKPLPLLKLD